MEQRLRVEAKVEIQVHKDYSEQRDGATASCSGDKGPRGKCHATEEARVDPLEESFTSGEE